MVVRTPVTRAAAAIAAAPGTVEHAARGPGVLEQRLLLMGRFFRGVQAPSRPRKNLPEARRARMSTCEARAGRAARGAGDRGLRPQSNFPLYSYQGSSHS